MASTTLKSDFDKAVEMIRTSSVPISIVIKLRLYALYKQATKGDAPLSGPWAFRIFEYAKWIAWSALSGKTNEAAMSEYIAEVKTFLAVPE